MSAWLARSLPPSLDAGARTSRRLRHRSLMNLSRMGHCAPTVMQTLLDVSETDAPWLVRLTAGLPEGIANTGGECGGITASLVLLGLRHRGETGAHGLPVIVYKGHDLLQRFADGEGTLLCREIRGRARVPMRCVGVVRRSPARCAGTSCRDCAGSIPEERARAYALLHRHWEAQEFHCAHAVLGDLAERIRVSEDLRDGTSGFTGGIHRRRWNRPVPRDGPEGGAPGGSPDHFPLRPGNRLYLAFSTKACATFVAIENVSA